ncbi:MAG TPA: polysaccharide deacetylase family protein [Actinomycetota bacterium]|nr:polysaccharide deacetylase family protein [Actinomycetota bacterium]
MPASPGQIGLETPPRMELILNFHGIGDPREGVPDEERPYWCSRELWPALADSMAEVSARGEVALWITFDDGNVSDLEHGLPALLERGLAATFHICAGRIGHPGYLSGDQLRALSDAGMRIGSHGWDHVDLRRVTARELERESVAARARIAAASGVQITEFAIPFGSYDRRVLRSLRDFGTVYTSDHALAPREGWLRPRLSYRNGWSAEDIGRFAADRSSPLERFAQRTRLLFKSLR